MDQHLTLILFGTFFAVFGLGCFIWAVLRTSGWQQAVGRVIASDTETVTIRYYVGKSAFTFEDTAPLGGKMGQDLTLRFDPKDPKNAMLDSSFVGFPMIALLVFLVGLAMITAGLT